MLNFILLTLLTTMQFIEHKNYHVTPGTNTDEFIVLHHTAGAYPYDLKILCGETNRMVSVHYYVRKNGEIHKIGYDTDIAWHAGDSEYAGYKQLNKYSIGIEIESLDGLSFTDEQREATEQLLVYLITKHNITKDKVVKHADVILPRGAKWDVGPNFYLEGKYKGKIKNYNDYVNYIYSLLSNNCFDLMFNYEETWKTEVKDTDKLFSDYSVDTQAKYLMDIAMVRNNKKVKCTCNLCKQQIKK